MEITIRGFDRILSKITNNKTKSNKFLKYM